MPTPTTIVTREASSSPALNLSGLAKLRWAVKNPPVDPDVSFAGKTVLVTGANVGLGFEAAIKYIEKGADKLFLGVRSAQKGEDAKQAIIQRTSCSSDRITIVPVDLSSFSSVREFVVALENETPYLDIALLNAGLANPSYGKSPEGWELALQVNVLSTALMAILLLPLLRRTAEEKLTTPQLTFVNSLGHADVKSEWFTGSLLQAANDESKFDATKSYCMVKLLGMAVMKHIAWATTRPDGTPEIIVNACCPFMTRTNLGRNFPLHMKFFMGVFQRFLARNAEEGSRTLVGATALGKESQGRFWSHDVLYPMGDLAENKELMNECWDEIAGVLLKVQPDVHKLLSGKM
ncbi:hypothetical protein BCR34DRAFT_474186 [Clohesyomyces aquaticus]|uniref:Short-chain dehydrogenase n=1 Tax=Clohesyomyces aquaticus TaxID=1231657 RepID=A0A1Y2A5Z7_9PLEO|nr:hypothetical protein BCR34DRAFT_474186 [Clohesyomyces aquaticus]